MVGTQGCWDLSRSTGSFLHVWAQGAVEERERDHSKDLQELSTQLCILNSISLVFLLAISLGLGRVERGTQRRLIPSNYSFPGLSSCLLQAMLLGFMYKFANGILSCGEKGRSPRRPGQEREGSTIAHQVCSSLFISPRSRLSHSLILRWTGWHWYVPLKDE